MSRTRLILILITAAVVILIFLLPKAVVQSENELANAPDTVAKAHAPVSIANQVSITRLRHQFETKKSSIFADSLWQLYTSIGNYDSAAWYAENSASFLKTTDSYLRAGNSYYEAFSYALEQEKQAQLGAKAREFLGKALEADPKLYDAKANEFALFSLGMLSIQSGQYDRAVDWLTKLVEVNPEHLQGQVFLGVALANASQKDKARQQFEKARKMTADPSVHATIDSYLKDLK